MFVTILFPQKIKNKKLIYYLKIFIYQLPSFSMSINIVRINLINFQHCHWQQGYSFSYRIILPLSPFYDYFLTLPFILNNYYNNSFKKRNLFLLKLWKIVEDVYIVVFCIISCIVYVLQDTLMIKYELRYVLIFVKNSMHHCIVLCIVSFEPFFSCKFLWLVRL